MEWWVGHGGSGSQTFNIRQTVTTGRDGLKEKRKKQNKTEGSKYKKNLPYLYGAANKPGDVWCCFFLCVFTTIDCMDVVAVPICPPACSVMFTVYNDL